MSKFSANYRPDTLVLDGCEWVRKEDYDQAISALRQKQRTAQAHNHQFAAINDLWSNLPLHHAHAPYAASAEAFRKHGLIERGYCTVTTVDCESRTAALAAAPLIADLARKAHGYALTVVRESLVVCTVPESQSYKAMGKERFQESKQAVLDWAESLLGVAA